MGDDVYKRSREGIVKVNRDGSKTVAYQSEFGKEFRYERNQSRTETLSRSSGELHRGSAKEEKSVEATVTSVSSTRRQNEDYLERIRSRDVPETPENASVAEKAAGTLSPEQSTMTSYYYGQRQQSTAANGKPSVNQGKEFDDHKSSDGPAVSRSTLRAQKVSGNGNSISKGVSVGTAKAVEMGSAALQKGTSFLQNSASGDSNQDTGDKLKEYGISGVKTAADGVKNAGVKAGKKVGGKAARTAKQKVLKQVEKAAAKTAQKTAAKTAQQTAKAVEKAVAKTAQVVARTAAKVASQATARATTTVTQSIVLSPVGLVVCGVLFFFFFMCSLGALFGGTGLITQRLDPSYNMPWYDLRQYVSELETKALQDAEQSLKDEVEEINSGHTPPNMSIPDDGSLWYASVMSIDGTTSLRQVQQIVRLLVGCCFSNLNFVEGGDNYDEKKAFIDKVYGSWDSNQGNGILWNWKSYVYDTGAVDSSGLHQYKVMYCISINDLDTMKERIGVGLSNEGSLMTTEQWNTFADAYGAYSWWAEQDLDQFWNENAGDPIYSDETTVTGTFILDARISYYGDDKIIAGSFGATINERDYLDPSLNVGQDALDYEQQVTTDLNGTELHTHTGIDLVTNPGVHVVSATAGTVIAVGKENTYSGLADQDHGNYVSILCQDNIVMTYSHLDSVAVEVGQTVEVASYLGTVGKSGKISPTIEAAVDQYVDRLYNNGQWYVDETISGEEKWGYVHLEVSINGYYVDSNGYMGLDSLEYPDN